MCLNLGIHRRVYTVRKESETLPKDPAFLSILPDGLHQRKKILQTASAEDLTMFLFEGHSMLEDVNTCNTLNNFYDLLYFTIAML